MLSFPLVFTHHVFILTRVVLYAFFLVFKYFGNSFTRNPSNQHARHCRLLIDQLYDISMTSKHCHNCIIKHNLIASLQYYATNITNACEIYLIANSVSSPWVGFNICIRHNLESFLFSRKESIIIYEFVNIQLPEKNIYLHFSKKLF